MPVDIGPYRVFQFLGQKNWTLLSMSIFCGILFGQTETWPISMFTDEAGQFMTSPKTYLVSENRKRKRKQIEEANKEVHKEAKNGGNKGIDRGAYAAEKEAEEEEDKKEK